MGEGRDPILYIAPWVDLGGSDKGTIDWFRNLDRERWAPSLITTQPSANRWLHQLEPHAEEIWDLPDLMPGNAFPEFILGFIESRDVRVVHIMNSRLAFDLLPDMACLPEPPVVVVQLHAEEPNQSGYVRYVARRYGNLVDAFSVTSRHLEEIVASYEIAPSKIEVIHSGVDSEHEFDPAGVEPLELNRPGVKRVLWPGRLVEQKDPMLALDVLACARERGGEFVLDVVGDGHLADVMRNRAEQLGVADMIEWHRPSQEMARWYRSADLMLMTSAYEGVPYVIYEALAMGVPVVAPSLPGNVEFMDADSGVLVEPRDDPEGYAEAIVSLLEDDERRRVMGERSRRRMSADFSLADMARRHVDLYERLLSRQAETARLRAGGMLGEPKSATSPAPAASNAPPPSPLSLQRKPPPDRTVGVIVPCFRHGIFLEACIDSIRAQTLAPARIVVVDDGSDDVETVEALARLERDPQVSVLRQPANLGPSAARNRALAELDTSYVLPIDADDELLPDALERMLAQLEAAPKDVGFIYPHIQYMGNRSDYAESPAYNLWLLMQQNYCPAPALFDRRLFEETGIRYAEEIVLGHEDWDLVLQLAERGVHGLPADGPTFRYRKQGFSRANAIDYGPDLFHGVIEGRHPGLYRDSEAIKARWAPALSIVLLDDDDGDGTWAPRDLSPLAAQTWRDFELLARGNLDAGARVVSGESESPLAWLQNAVHQARGRWVLLLPRPAAAVLESPCFAEQLLHAFVENDGVVGVVLGDLPGSSRHVFSQLDDIERLSAKPVGLAFERLPWGRMPELHLGLEDSPLADIAIGLQAQGHVQWRSTPTSGSSTAWGKRGDREGPASLDVNLPRGEGPDAATRRMILHQPPRLPELVPSAIRRWERPEPWTPSQSLLLCRHVDPKTGMRMVTAGRESPRGHTFEHVLGAVHRFPVPDTRRLVYANHRFATSDRQGDLAEDVYDLGYVEQKPLPMLVRLEVRRVVETGQEILVAGPNDPLGHASEGVELLGWIEPCPILPRAVLHTGPWAVVGLRRQIDGRAWRHRYCTAPLDEAVEGQLLGSLGRHPVPGAVALRLRPDGRLASELCSPGRASRDPRRIGRWLGEPLAADSEGGARVRGAASRLRHLTRNFGERRLAEEEGEVLGYLPRQLMLGCSALYSTIHPVTGDQLVTRSPHEAEEAGYLMDGILGAIFDPPDAATTPPEQMPWGRVSRR